MAAKPLMRATGGGSAPRAGPPRASPKAPATIVPLARAREATRAAPAWPISPRWADIDLAGVVTMALTERLGYPPETVEVKVVEGIVALSGFVESGSLKDIIEQTVADVAGVRSLESRLRVLPPSRMGLRAISR